MKNINVRLCEPTEKGRLYYCYDPETSADLLLLKSRFRERWSYFLNIGGEMLFDIDANRVLRSVECVIPKRAWKIAPLGDIPQPSQSADLEIVVSRKHESVELPVAVITNESRSYVHILIGKIESNATWVRLSNQCLASIVEHRLKGFLVILEE